MDKLWNDWIEKQNDLDIAIITLETTDKRIFFEIDDACYTLEQSGAPEQPVVRLSSTQEGRPKVAKFVSEVNDKLI